MSSTKQDPFNSRNPRTFGVVEEVMVRRGNAEKAFEKLRPYSATGARAIAECVEETNNPKNQFLLQTNLNQIADTAHLLSTMKPSAAAAAHVDFITSSSTAPRRSASATAAAHQLHPLSTAHMLLHRPHDLMPWDPRQTAAGASSSSSSSGLNGLHSSNPFIKNSVTSHLPHVAKSSHIRQVPLAHLQLSMEIDDTVGLPTHRSTWAARHDARAASLGSFLVQTMNERFPDEDDDDNDDGAHDADDRSSRNKKQQPAMKSSFVILPSAVKNGSSIDGKANVFGDETSSTSNSRPQSRLIKHEENENEDNNDNDDNEEEKMEEDGMNNDNDDGQNDSANIDYSLAQAAHRTKSMYLSNLQKSFHQQNHAASSSSSSHQLLLLMKGRQNSSSTSTCVPVDDKKKKIHEEAMQVAFQQLAEHHEHLSTNLQQLPDEAETKRLLMMMYKENVEKLSKQKQNGPTTENSAMADIAPPSSGFESDKKKSHETADKNNNNKNNNNKNIIHIHHHHYQLSQQQQQPSACVVTHTLPSGRGFFMNGKQRDELVKNHIIAQRAGTSSSSGTSPPNTANHHQQQQQDSSSLEYKKHRRLQTQQHNQRVNERAERQQSVAAHTGLLFQDNACRVDAEAETQRALHRSWKFRDQLHIRHSVKASHLPKGRRTIINNPSLVDDNNNWTDVVVGVKPKQ